MKIFTKNSLENSNIPERSKRSEGDRPISKNKTSAPIKKELSESAIREKLASHVETSDAAKTMAIKKTKQFGQNFMSESIKPVVDKEQESASEVKSPNTKDFTLNSDIAFNDPKDTNTQEKLKSALTRGAFNFNPKEREALEKILGV